MADAPLAARGGGLASAPVVWPPTATLPARRSGDVPLPAVLAAEAARPGEVLLGLPGDEGCSGVFGDNAPAAVEADASAVSVTVEGATLPPTTTDGVVDVASGGELPALPEAAPVPGGDAPVPPSAASSGACLSSAATSPAGPESVEK